MTQRQEPLSGHVQSLPVVEGQEHRFAELEEEVAEGGILIKQDKDLGEDDGSPWHQQRRIVRKGPQLGFSIERVLDKAEEEIGHRGK
eukprot:2361509-Prorocentrum_lima.AAC.1